MQLKELFFDNENAFRDVFLICTTAAIAAPVVCFIWESSFNMDKYNIRLAEHQPFSGFELPVWLVVICAVCSIPGWFAIGGINNFIMKEEIEELILTPFSVWSAFIPIRLLGSSNDTPTLIFIYLGIIVLGLWMYNLNPISAQLP